MRCAFLLLIVLAGAEGPQWRRFGAKPEPTPPSSIAGNMLTAHNRVRAEVGLAPLVWSDRLAAYAQDWANSLLARKQLFHRPISSYGENLFEVRGASVTAAYVVAAWAGESRDYDYSSNKCRSVCGHYTQIVWSGTKEVGCAVARGGGREFWVCNYDPPGNWVGKRPY
jgi:pathogenesis-related protein 1